MTGANERRQWLALRRNESLLEDNALVAWQHRLADADQAVAMAHRRWHVGDFVAPCLALADAAAELLKSFQKKRLDVVRLQAASFGPLHLLPDAVDAASIYGIVGEGTLFKEVLQPDAVEGALHNLREPCTHLGQFPIAHGFDEEFAQGTPVEYDFAKDVEHLPAERLACLLQLLQERLIDLALTGFVRHQVPQVAHLGLPNAVNAPEALLDAVRVPGQVVVHHQV